MFSVRGWHIVAVLAVWAASPLVQAANFYRYTNDYGSIVVDFRVPAEYVNRGYEILNDDGMVIQVVPPALTSEQRNNEQARRKRELDASLEQRRLQEWDESLLRRYSTVEDIEAARDRALRDLKIRVSILKSNRRSLRQKIENAQARVAEAERVGGKPSSTDLDMIEETKREIDSTERAIADREAQIEAVRADFWADSQRFKQLKEVVELRRSLESPQR